MSLNIPFDKLVPEISEELQECDPNQLALYVQIGYELEKSGFLSAYMNYSEQASGFKRPDLLSPMYSRLDKSETVVTTSEPNKERVKSSAKLGVAGEAKVLKYLQDSFEVENVAQRGFSGDLILKRSHSMTRVLVEIKNYSQPVPGAEVEKFRRDLQHNLGMHAGLFISLNSNITGVPEPFRFIESWEDRHIPVIFLQSNSAEIIKASANILWDYVSAKDRLDKNAEIIQEKYAKFYRKIDKLSKLLNALGCLRAHISNLQTTLLQDIGKIHTETFRLEVQLKEILDSLQRTFYEDSGQERPIEEVKVDNLLTELDKNTELYNTESLLIKDEEHRTLVHDIMSKRFARIKGKIFAAYHEKKIQYYRESNKVEPFMWVSLLKTKSNVAFHVVSKTDKSDKTEKPDKPDTKTTKHGKTEKKETEKKETTEEKRKEEAVESDQTEDVHIPLCAKYEDNWAVFGIDKHTPKNGNYEAIVRFIGQL